MKEIRYACQWHVATANCRCRNREDEKEGVRLCSQHRKLLFATLTPNLVTRPPRVIIRCFVNDKWGTLARLKDIPLIKGTQARTKRDSEYASIAAQAGRKFTGGNGTSVFEPKLPHVSIRGLGDELIADGYHLITVDRKIHWKKGQADGYEITLAFMTTAEMEAQDESQNHPLVLNEKQEEFVRLLFQNSWTAQVFDNPPNSRGQKKTVVSLVAPRSARSSYTLRFLGGLWGTAYSASASHPKSSQAAA
ncbi:MAG: hypothetical protein KGZ30_00220 [Anaplasmataceae bacterium]|nr:hypothetical protein [Anaplasmataceae bacterium]